MPTAFLKQNQTFGIFIFNGVYSPTGTQDLDKIDLRVFDRNKLPLPPPLAVAADDLEGVSASNIGPAVCDRLAADSPCWSVVGN